MAVHRIAKEVHIYRLASTDPILNLATEDWIFRTTDLTRAAVLLLWRNNTTVVIGRHQNPWTECNLRELTRRRIPFVRRLSGGGAVYHDLGNSNFTIMTDRTSFHKAIGTQLVVRALRRVNIEAAVSSRNDILVNGRKVSGAAYKLSGGGAYHHGTMLVHADLPQLRKLLQPTLEANCVTTQGVASVRSSVINLRELVPSLDHATISEAIADEFIASHTGPVVLNTHLSDASTVNIPHVDSVCSELQSWDHRFGGTPSFCHTVEGPWDDNGRLKLQIDSSQGLIAKVTLCEGNLTSTQLGSLSQVLSGKRYWIGDIIHSLTTQLPASEWTTSQQSTLIKLFMSAVPEAI